MRLMGTTENYIPPAGIEFVRRQPLDVDAMFADPARRAEELGLEAPHVLPRSLGAAPQSGGDVLAKLPLTVPSG